MKRVLILFIILFCTVSSSAEQPADVPEQLKPWVPWVLARHPKRQCAVLDASRVCEWPGSLMLSLNEVGGSFDFAVVLDREQSVLLPGSRDSWPLAVRVLSGGREIVASVLQRDGRPQIKLQAGTYQIQGKFVWEKLPDSIAIPPNSGIVSASLFDESLPVRFAKDGELWLKQASTERAEEDSLRIGIHRKLVEGVPFEIETHLELQITGRARSISLGNVFIENSLPVSISSDLSYQFDESYRLSVQGKPGRYHLWISSVLAKPPVVLRPKFQKIPDWPREEIWTWFPNEALRSVRLSGARQVEPQRTELPKKWNAQTAYLLAQKDSLTFSSERRGIEIVPSNQLRLEREFWLDFDGVGYTVRDRLTGAMHQGWRLNLQKEGDLGSVKVSDQDQLITLDASNSLPGVELRDADVQVVAESRLENHRTDLPAVAWDHDVQSLSASLYLPPGWTLFEATGVDELHTSWLQSWSLFDFFLVFLASIACAKLFGLLWGLVALLALILAHGTNGPYQIWFHLLIATSLLRVLPSGKAKKLVGAYFGLSLFALAVVLVPYSIGQVRQGLYPHLRAFWYDVRPTSSYVVGRAEKVLEESAPESYYDEPSAGSYYGGSLSRKQAPLKQIMEVDPNSALQTGPGVPIWRGQQVSLRWRGPVAKTHRVKLYLLSPGVNLILSFSRVLFFLLFAGLFFIPAQIKKKMGAFVAASVVFLVVCPGAAQAEDFPSTKLLDELEERVLKGDCSKNCVMASQLELSVEDESLELEVELDARSASAWPFPGPVSQLRLIEVKLNGKPTKALRRDKAGFVWVRVPQGRHSIVMQGELRGGSVVTLSFPEAPGHLKVKAPGWKLDGLSPTGKLASSLQLIREAPVQPELISEQEAVPAGGGRQTEHFLPYWYHVSRRLSIGLKWSVQTTVVRQGVLERAAKMSIPLLAGERVVSKGSLVKDGFIKLNFPRGASEVSWESTLEKKDILLLKAGNGESYNERWELVCSPIFRCVPSGLTPTINVRSGDYLPVWHPWPGEELKLEIFKPQAKKGRSLTIDSVKVAHRPGNGLLETDVSFSLKSSKNGRYVLKLPSGVNVQELKIDGVETAMNQLNAELIIPVSVGKHDIDLKTRTVWSHNLRQSFPMPEFAGEVSNISTTISVPRNRWILFTGGVRFGPVVLFWGELLVVLIFAVLLGRIKSLPLGTLAWVLLGLGLTSLHVVCLLIPVVWFVAIAYRKKNEVESWWRFNFYQLALVFLTLLALSVFFMAARNGLILSPDMKISGNGSTNSFLKWYQDRSPGVLTEPWVFWLPIWLWRMVMFAWSLWISFALLRWLRWAWTGFSQGAVWKKKPKLKRA